ncbi:hypothetical protein Q8A73_017047 [Channa argus]|nr:hypothetical protein Q8A73_017047 [Channa argus]
MAFANQGRSIPRVGLRRTLRFQWRSSDRELRLIRLSLQDLALKEFFGRFSDVVSAARYVRDPLGFWTGCRQFQVLLHPDVPEAIRADASVRVTLVPGGGDLRVKLSQYTDDTTLLLDSDECVVRALEVLRIFEGSQELGSTLANARKLTLLGKVLVLKADMLSSVLHLAYVFPLLVAIRRPLARTIFDFLWGGRYEWVACGRMMSGLAEGCRDVPDLRLKLDTIFVASLLQDMASEVGHPASIGMKYFFLYAARGILNWSNVGPRSEQLPWHYELVAKWLRAHPKALEDGIWKQQRVLYRVVRGKVNPSPLLGVPSSVTVGVQAVGQSNGLKDLNWSFLHRTLPVRDKIHRHGLGRSPLCPRPSCGAGETAYHVMWECSFARQLWAKAKKVVGRAKPDFTLTWQVVERGFVGAHIRSGWGILWLLLSLWFCCIQMFPVLLHPDAEEAIRADASVKVTLVPEGGDLRVKLSQYADDTTLLLDSDECVVRALELFEDFGRVSGARHNIGKCTVKGGGRVVMLLRVDYQRVKGQ